MPVTGWAADVQATAHVIVAALGPTLEITGEDGHHLERVRRVRAGERITAADGVGHWRVYEVAAAGHAKLSLAGLGDVIDEPTLVPPLSVAFALTKREKPEIVVQKLTELGVDRILPVLAARSVVHWEDRKAAAALIRWNKVVREAAMQCRRSRLPEVAPVAPLASLAGARGLVLADRGPGVPPEPGPEGWTVLVGPEGGFSADELDGLERAGPVGVLSVGPHVLRAETAAIAAASVLAARRTVA